MDRARASAGVAVRDCWIMTSLTRLRTVHAVTLISPLPEMQETIWSSRLFLFWNGSNSVATDMESFVLDERGEDGIPSVFFWNKKLVLPSKNDLEERDLRAMWMC